jgi:hypothetical protein
MDHLQTFKGYQNRRFIVWDLLFFFALPCLGAVVLLYFKIVLTSDLATLLVTSLSIFAALLFNLLLLTFDLTQKAPDRTVATRRDLLKAIYSNISYSILVAI